MDYKSNKIAFSLNGRLRSNNGIYYMTEARLSMNKYDLEVCNCHECEPFDNKHAKLTVYGKNTFLVIFVQIFSGGICP